ncbi:MAG: saccharopine dehydrogenase C-terminal domain-containing protein [Bacteroidota bacterium]
MSKVLINRARGVTTQKYALSSSVSPSIILTSRVKRKYDLITKELGQRRVQIAQVDTENVPQLVGFINTSQPDIVIHVALPYQDRCKEKGLIAILGSGFDLGITSMVTVFATHFNPEINFQENTQEIKYWENENWIETEPHGIHQDLTSPGMGVRRSYLIYHRELDSLTNNYPSLISTQCWMTFREKNVTLLKGVYSIGMGRIDISIRKRSKIIPLQFLKINLPEPRGLGENYTKETYVEGRFKGLKDEWEKSYSIWKGYIHQIAFEESRTQVVSFTTTAPTYIGAKMLFSREWYGEAGIKIGEIHTNFFSQYLPAYSLLRQEEVNGNLEVN